MEEWIFSGPATHHGAAYILSPVINSVLLVVAVEKWTLLVNNQVT